MTEQEIRGPVGKTDEVIDWKWKKATFTFTLKDESDDRFGTKIERAMIEHIANNTRIGEEEGEFIASNGVVIHISYPQKDYSTMPDVPPHKDYVLDQLDKDGNRVYRERCEFFAVPLDHQLVLTKIGKNHDEVKP